MKIRTARPVLPRSEVDPVGAKRQVSASYRKISTMMARIKRAVFKLIDELPRESVALNKINSTERRYLYQVDANQLQNISFYIQQLIYSELLNNPDGTLTNRWWLDGYLSQQYERGTRDALKSSQNLASVSAVGPELSQQMRGLQLEGILLDPGYQQRIGFLKARVFEELIGLSGDTKKDLATTLARGMAAGDGIATIKRDIEKRVGVSKSRAERIARTEINNAYREANAAETDQLNDTLWRDSGLVTRLLWYSALSPTTRPTHARRHGRVYSTTGVRDFYSKDGNAINCLCNQVEVLVDKKTGEVINQELVDEVAAERPRFENKAV